ncbi:MAG: hypothetical protein ACYC6A_05105 [Armatimonadota bacterium]
MHDMDIDAVFHFRHKEANIFAVCLLLLLLALIAVPLIQNPEIIRYVPEFLPRFNWGMVIGTVFFLGMMAGVVYAGQRGEHARRQLFREATKIYRSVTPQPVTLHIWWAAGGHKNLLVPYCSLRPADTSETTPARVVRPLLFKSRLKLGQETRVTAEWFADPERSKVEVLRFEDGTIAAAVPVETPVVAMPPPPRLIPLPVRVCLRTGYGFLFVGTAITILFGTIMGISWAPVQIREAMYRFLPPRQVSGTIIRIGGSPNDQGTRLTYLYGNNTEEDIYVDDATAVGYPVGTPITVEYVPHIPGSRVVDLPQRSHISSSGEVIAISAFCGLMMLLFGACVVVTVIQGLRQLRILRTHAFGWATLVAIDGKSSHPLRAASLTLRLRLADEEVQTVMLPKGIPAHWLRDMEVTVLFDPADPTRLMPLARLLFLTAGYFTITHDGRVVLSPYGIVMLLLTIGFAGIFLLNLPMLVVTG